MKAQFAGAALLALALAGCGGKNEFTVGGNLTDGSNAITPLPNSGLILANGEDVISVPLGATSYAFPKKVPYGDSYSVVVVQHPQYMTCQPTATTGTAGQFESISVPISCAQNTHTVFVTVTGLEQEGLQLINGSSAAVAVAKATPSAQFQGIPVGVAYGITIYQQPTGQTCTIANGAGVMADADRANTVVTCVNNPA